MNGEEGHIDVKELLTPTEILESATLGVIEILRRKRVCFCPELSVGPGDMTDFYACLRWLGDSNVLIFCAPNLTKETAHAKIHHYVYGGDFDHVFDRDGCVGTDHGEDWTEKDEMLFPNKFDNLLVIQSEPGAEPKVARPPDNHFWGHYAVLSIFGRDEKLHLLHIGLSGGACLAIFFGG